MSDNCVVDKMLSGFVRKASLACGRFGHGPIPNFQQVLRCSKCQSHVFPCKTRYIFLHLFPMYGQYAYM